MNDKVKLPINTEYTVSVENIKFRLLVSSVSSGEKSEMPLVLHNHVSAELFAAIKGEIKIATEKDIIILTAGDIAVVPPGLKHTMIPNDDNSNAAVVSFICNKRSDRNASNLYKKLHRYVSGTEITVKRGIPSLCETVKKLSDSDKSTPDVMPAIQAVMLLMELSLADDEGSAISTDEKKEKYDIHRMMRLDNIIGRYYMRDLKMSEVAEKLFISSRQLDRIVRKRYGKTLHKVIMEKRIQAAEKMLLTTNMTIESIGSAVGFGSTPGFYREFCAFYGITPAEYRKMQKISSDI